MQYLEDILSAINENSIPDEYLDRLQQSIFRSRANFAQDATTEDASITGFMPLSAQTGGLTAALEANFTGQFIEQYNTDETMEITSAAVSSDIIQKKIGPINIHIMPNETELLIHGLSKEKCSVLLSHYFKISDIKLRQDTSLLDDILNGEIGKQAPLTLSSQLRWDNVSIFFDTENRTLQFIFHLVKVRANLNKRQMAFMQKLRIFIEEQYSTHEPAFVTQMLIGDDIIHLSTANDPLSAARETIIAIDAHAIATVTEDESSILLGNMVAQIDLEADLKTSDRADAASPSASLGHSSDSGTAKGSINIKDFYVKTSVNTQTGGLSFAVSKLRPDTYLGRQQGAHITAYIVFVTAILETVDEQSIHDIPHLLTAIARQFIPEDDRIELNQRIETTHTLPERFEKNYRKTLTAELRNKSVDERKVQQIKKDMKIAQAVYLANLIDDLSNEVLKGINQSEHVLYLRPGKKDAASLGAEGAKIRTAMQGLRAIQYVINWNSETELKAALLEEFKEGNLRSGLRAFLNIHPKTKISNKRIDNFFETYFNSSEEHTQEALSSRKSRTQTRKLGEQSLFARTNSLVELRTDGIANSTLKTISKLMFDLFDFDYYEYKTSLTLIALYKAIKEKQDEGITDGVICEKIMAELAELENKPAQTVLKMFQKTNLSHSSCTEVSELMSDLSGIGIDIDVILDKVEQRTTNNATEVILQHLRIVMQFAFPRLHTLPENSKRYIFEEFIILVQTEMHWETPSLSLPYEELESELSTSNQSSAKLGFGSHHDA